MEFVYVLPGHLHGPSTISINWKAFSRINFSKFKCFSYASAAGYWVEQMVLTEDYHTSLFVLKVKILKDGQRVNRNNKYSGGWRGGSGVSPCSQRGPRFSVQHTWDLQPSLTPVPENMLSFSLLCGHCTHVIHRHECKENTYTHFKHV